MRKFKKVLDYCIYLPIRTVHSNYIAMLICDHIGLLFDRILS